MFALIPSLASPCMLAGTAATPAHPAYQNTHMRTLTVTSSCVKPTPSRVGFQGLSGYETLFLFKRLTFNSRCCPSEITGVQLWLAGGSAGQQPSPVVSVLQITRHRGPEDQLPIRVKRHVLRAMQFGKSVSLNELVSCTASPGQNLSLGIGVTNGHSGSGLARPLLSVTTPILTQTSQASGSTAYTSAQPFHETPGGTEPFVVFNLSCKWLSGDLTETELLKEIDVTDEQ